MDAENPSAVAAAEPVPLRRNRDFNLLWSGQAASILGSEISEIAYPLLILVATGSAAQAGLVTAAVLIANLVALLPAGVVADRYPRKRLLVISSVAQFGAVATVVPAVVFERVSIAHLVTVGAIQGIAAAFYSGASRGAVRRIVPTPQLAQAISRSQARDQAAYLVGPAIGGALFGVARFLPFLCDAVSFLVIALAAALVRGPLDPPRADRPVREPLRRGITNGMRYVFANPYLRTVAIWAAAINGVAMGMVLMIIIMAGYRGAGPAEVGLVAATGSLGGLAGALLSGRLIKLLPGRRMVLTASWVMILCPVGVALAPVPSLIGVTGAVALFVTMPVNIILLTRSAELTAHDMQAQTGNAMMLVGSCLKWLALPVFGLLSDRFGPVAATLVGAGLYVCIALWLTGRAALRQLDQPALLPAG